jgi:flagellar protein FlaG
MEITSANGAAPMFAPTPEPVPPEQAAANRDLAQAVKTVNAAGALGSNNELTFQMDRTTKMPVIRIIDKDTNEVVEQIPPEYILQLAATLGTSAE